MATTDVEQWTALKGDEPYVTPAVRNEASEPVRPGSLTTHWSALDWALYKEVWWRMYLLASDPPIDPDTHAFAVHSGTRIEIVDEDGEDNDA